MNPHETSTPRATFRGRIHAAAPLASLVVLVALAATVRMTGCARNSPAEADMRETRLTRDGAVKTAARISPDGRWIAYGAQVDPGKGGFGVFLVPRSGGEPRKLTPDSVGAYPISWAADGKGIYCRSYNSTSAFLLGLDGAVRPLRELDAFSRLVAVSPDGRTEYIVRFNRDNRDLATRIDGGKLEFKSPTPEWEEDASLGPGQGELTVVATPSYQSAVTRISVWTPATGGIKPLPLPEGMNTQPSWTPDGKILAFTGYRDGQANLWLYEASTTRAARLTEGAEDASSPSWAPDGDWLAFVRSTKTSHLFAGDPRKGERRQLTDGPARDYMPMASPDGRWIAFVRRPAPAAGGDRGPRLCVMPATGGAVKELDLKGVALPMKVGEGTFSWAEDGSELAVNASEASGRLDIYRIDRDGRRIDRVTVDPGDELDPRWAPDGKHICFTRVGGGVTEVAVVPSTGGLPVVVSAKGALGESGIWSPRSDRIAYVGYPDDGSYEIWVAPLASPGARRLVLHSKELAWPLFWSKDGREIVVARGRGPEWYFNAVSVENGAEILIGRMVPLPPGRNYIADLLPAGEKYRDQFFPGGQVILADGKDSGDIYLIRARAIVESGLLAARAEAGR